MKIKNIINKVLKWQVLLTIQAVASLLLCYELYELGTFPFKYFIVIIGIIMLLLVISYFFTRSKDGENTKRVIIGKVFSILLSIMLAIASLAVVKGNEFLAGLGITYESHKVSVVVLRDSDFEEITDLKDSRFKISSRTNGVIISNAIENIEKEIGKTINVSAVDSFEDLARCLYNNETEAIIINEANRELIKESEDFKDWEKATRVIYQTNIKEKIDNALTDIDVTNETFTILISGIDEYNEDDPKFDPAYMGGELKRSDVNMLATINPKTHQILLTSIPRDTYVKLANYNGNDKLTHASIYGVSELVDTISDFFNCEINYYFRVNFSSLIDIVDALGGVDIDNPVPFTVDDLVYTEGKMHLNGWEALNYCRDRKSFADGDNARGRNQQRVLKGLIKRATSTEILIRYNSFLETLSNSFETTLSDVQIKSIVQMQLNEMPTWDVQSVQLEVSSGRSTECYSMGSANLYVSYPAEDSRQYIEELIRQMENGDIISVE